MQQLEISEEIQNLMQPFLEKGFSFRYFYEKGGDSSCVYICRFQKGKDFFDWREVSGVQEIHIFGFVKGEYKFPSLKSFSKKKYRSFAIKSFFKTPTFSEYRQFVAELLLAESEKGNFLGIEL